jgi:hypothetical protein
LLMKRLALAMLLSLAGLSLLHAQKPTAPREFFPLNVGTYWVYKGFVGWFDSETDKPATGEVTWRMSVLKVYRKKGLVAAVVNGFPADLDWSAGATEPKPWLIVEDEKHQVYYENLGPDFDLSKFDAGDHVFDKFLVEDNFFFQWPLQKGARFCATDAKGRDDDMYCWIVADTTTKKLDSVQGAPSGEQPVFRMQYRSLPDDTTIQLVPGIGLLGYEYHHHGTVADTDLQLVEFHPAPEIPDVQGPKP